MKKTTSIFFILGMVITQSSLASSYLFFGDPCVVSETNQQCMTVINTVNNSGKKTCLWRAAQNGKPLEIFHCQAASTINSSKNWTKTSVNYDVFEMKSHDSWPTQDPLGLEHAYNTGTLLDTDQLTAEYGKITAPNVCQISNPSEQCTTEIFANKLGKLNGCIWRKPTNGKPLEIFACNSVAIPNYSKNWTKTSSTPDDFVFMSHVGWPTQDPMGLNHAYSQGIVLDEMTIQANIVSTGPLPEITSVTAGCKHRYCLNIRGTDFAANASVIVRENRIGSAPSTFRDNLIYNRSFTTNEDKFVVPIVDMSRQAHFRNNGLCIRVNNNGDLSNEVCLTRPANIEPQPPLMGSPVLSYDSQQDVHADSYIVKGATNNVLKFFGNSWKKVPMNYTVTPNTILEFDFKSTHQEPEITGIGFILQGQNNMSFNRFWQIFGTDINHGNQSHRNYVNQSGFKSYRISIGEVFTGQISHIVFISDEDTRVGQSVIFQSPNLIEEVNNSGPSGWDYGLTTRNIRSYVDFNGDDQLFDFIDETDPSTRHYRIGIQNEAGFGHGFPGPNGLSYMPNGSSSPSTINWLSSSEGGYTVEMKTDQYTFDEVNYQPGRNMFTWFAFLDKNSDTNPHPMDTQVSLDVKYNEYNTGGSAGRMIVGMDLVLDGVWYEIEINTYMKQWQHYDREVVFSDFVGTNKKFININGRFFNAEVPLNSWYSLIIDWEYVLNWLIDNGHIPSGVRSSPTLKPSLKVAIENMSKSTSGTGSGVTHLQFKNLKVDAKR
ncbi:hypothetical protein [Marinicella litoralis]|uniref:Uncharacterized protein n=1 Tax=Marinicella litoralis TaxID=644220 RepID=A0A4R6XXY1_9GAMM|nr:hypothetical protein [Marinicella litoralis]TDR23479.1 hypothetical protein C8D91_0341 [Marinicella litoralis]